MFSNNFGKHENVECGLIWIIQSIEKLTLKPPKSAPIPLESVSITASVVHAVAQVELTQVYVNKEEQPIEAIYYFPVDSNGGVTHFHAELEGRTITGVVKPQEEAKEQYKNAVKKNKTAFLMESDKPDIFKVRVGFLKPGSQVKIVIGYVTEVKNEKGSNAIRFFIPTTVAPRYIPSTDTSDSAKDLKKMKFSESSPAPLSITVNVAIQGKIKSIQSPTHEIQSSSQEPIPTKENWSRNVVKLSGDTTDMDRDFVLLIQPEDVHVPRLYSEKIENSTTLMTHLIPSFNLGEQKVELIFVLDRSGSMEGSSIKLAKKALTLFLHSLPVDCYFNIVGFGSSCKFLFKESVKYDDGTFKKAIAHAKALKADLGGTEILQPLKKIFSKAAIPEYLRQIFVLTDGEVFNTDLVIGICKANAHKIRVFALGIGNDASHHLVEGLAEAGGGTASFVTDNEPMDSKVLQQLKNAIQPSLTNVILKWTGLENSPPPPAPVISKVKSLIGYGKPVPNSGEPPAKSFIQVPEKVSPIFDGAQLVAFGVFPGELPTGIEIVAESPDGPLSIDIKLSDENDVGSNGMLHKLAAIKAIHELEIKVAELNQEFRAKAGAEDEIKKEIIRIACQNGLASKYTSFVAVDTGSDTKVQENWIMQSRYVPTQIAHGWHGGVRKPPLTGGGPSSSSTQSARKCCFSNAVRKQLVTRAARKGAPATNPSKKDADDEDDSDIEEEDDSDVEEDVDSDVEEDDDSDVEEGDDGASSVLPKRPVLLTRGCLSTPINSIDSSSDEDSKMQSHSQPLTPQDNLHTLVATQSFNGSFALNEAFSSAVGKELNVLLEEAEKNGWNNEAWATALALAYLNEKLKGLKDSWELVEIKAKKWLQKNFGKDMDAMMAAALVHFKSG